MFNSKEEIKKITLSEFINRKLEDQKRFLKQVNITSLKHPKDSSLLKKFIAIKVLVTARQAAEEKSLLDLTAHFRNAYSYLPFLNYLPISTNIDIATKSNTILSMVSCN